MKYEIESLEHTKKEPVVGLVRQEFEDCLNHASNKQSTGGSVVEFSPATREARVRFPASANEFFDFIFIFLFRLIIYILVLCIVIDFANSRRQK